MPASPVRIVDASQGRALRQFIRLPWAIYRDDPYWVAPLLIDQKKVFNPARNPFCEHGQIVPFLAQRDGRPVGRIAAIINDLYNSHHGVNEGCWGFFECVDDTETATALFDHVAAWFRDSGIETVLGPMNPSTNHECGLLVDGFDFSPMLLTTYNPAYYVGLVEGYGMETAKTMFAYRASRPEALPEKIVNVAKRIRRQGGYTIRPFDMANFDREVAELLEVYNDAWSGNWGFVPFTDREFKELAAEMRRIAIPELCPVAEQDGKVVAFVLAMPDINYALKHARGRLFPTGLLKILWYKRKIKHLRVVVLGMRQDHWNTGVTACLYHDFITAGMRMGYQWAEMSWILEDNPVRRIIEMFGSEIYKTYRVYRLPV